MSPLRAGLIRLGQRAWRRLPSRARYRFLKSTTDTFLVGVVGLITDERGRVLLLEHRFRVPWPWGLPGGHLDRGEDFIAALARELEEEAGLTVELDATPVDVEIAPHIPGITVTVPGRASGEPPRHLSWEITSGAFFAPDALPEGLDPYHARIIQRWCSRSSDCAPPRPSLTSRPLREDT